MKNLKSSLLLLMLAVALLMPGNPASAQVPQNTPLTPVVLFPGYGGTRLQVNVHNQTVAPECPRSGVFEYALFGTLSEDFSQVCMDKLLTLVYHFDSGKPVPFWPEFPPRISEQRGVSVTIADYGMTESAPLYEPLFAFLEQSGYTRNVNIRVAGYDFRLTPDMRGFMQRTVALIEKTYWENHNTPVHLVGHSNGPLYAQYLLTHTTQQWKNKYIQGFTPIAGNWPGQGAVYSYLFTGLNIVTGTYPADTANAASSAALWESFPSTYMSASNPAYYGDREIILRIGPAGKEYTPKDAMQLFKDAGLRLAQKIAPYYFGKVKFLPPFFPYVDTYAEKGSGLDTIVGVQLPDLTVGQPIGDAPVFITLDGDSNQEYITNDAIRVWQVMPCYHFELNDNPGVDHLSLALASPAVWQRLLTHLQQQPLECQSK